MGRLITTERRNATGGFDIQQTEYDIAGRVTRQSEWAPIETSIAQLKWTKYDYTMYSDFDSYPGTPTAHADPLGRIHAVTTPDDPTPETPTTETSYDGTTTSVTVHGIQGYENGAPVTADSTTTYTNDAFGRLTDAVSPGGAANAHYEYDENDHLIAVNLTDPGNPSHVQTRRFQYDLLGRLRLAANPESGTVTYTAYDARGNLLEYTDAAQSVFETTYDAADRVLSRTENDALLSNMTYDDATGRIVMQDSYKIEPDGSNAHVALTQFDYGPTQDNPCPSGYPGLNGRLRSMTTSIEPWAQEVQTLFCQDTFGMTSAVRYPDNESGRTLSEIVSTYQNGYLHAMTDDSRNVHYITDVRYAAGGVPTEIDRTGIQDVSTLDSRNRPSQFRVFAYAYVNDLSNSEGISCADVSDSPDPALKGLSCPPGNDSDKGGFAPIKRWDSGPYVYDMAGNVQSIGLNSYYYDGVMRLIHASVPSSANNLLDYGYDAFGNMVRQSQNNYPFVRTFTVDWRTNRLTRADGGTDSAVYEYDGNGNMIAEGQRGLVFDGQNHLREVMDPERGAIGKYDYDSSGFRVRSEADGKETFFVRDSTGNVLSEYQRPIGSDAAPVWNKDYVYAFGKPFALVKNDTPAPPKRPWVTNVDPAPDEYTAGHLTLNWEPSTEPDILGYVIDKAWFTPESLESLSPMPVHAIKSVLADQHSWDDKNDLAAEAHCMFYTISAMDEAGNVSPPGPTLKVCPQDSDDVPVPSDVVAIPGDGSVHLTWSLGGAEPTRVLGFILERKHDARPPNLPSWSRLNDILLTSPEYLDRGVTNGTGYTYRVRMVDSANRESAPSDEASATPVDHTPPSKVFDLFAEPDRPAGSIIVSWRRGMDADVARYLVQRDSVQIGTVQVNDQVDDYSFTDAAAPEGLVASYTVIAQDTSGNLSAVSDAVTARARVHTIHVPSLPATTFVVNTNGTISYDGWLPADCPAGQTCDLTFAGNNTTAEDDDVMVARLTWPPASSTAVFNVYRKAPHETHYLQVGSALCDAIGPCGYDDPTIANDQYTYYVTMLNGMLQESGAPPESIGGSDHFLRPLPARPVRNVTAVGARGWYDTVNANSRLVQISWARIVEPDLAGYNVYRRGTFYYDMAVFMSAPVWIRLNDAPLPPSHNYFDDASVGGLGGYFTYMVRPVNRKGVEGSIGKLCVNDFADGSTSPGGTGASVDHIPLPTDTFPSGWNFLLDADQVRAAIYAAPHGPLNYAGTPPAPSNVKLYIRKKADVEPDDGSYVQSPTLFADLQWTMASPPANLRGFYVETSGSSDPDGSWQRITKQPVAWWERRYIAQGIGLTRLGGLSGHVSCLSYRVIAVYEDGAESAPTVMSQFADCHDSHQSCILGAAPTTSTCPATLAAPTNLRASTLSNGPPCQTRLEWDVPPGANASTVYYVYRLKSSPNYLYFYDTGQLTGVTAGVGRFDDLGADSSDSTDLNTYCPYGAAPGEPPTERCRLEELDVYFVTAFNGTGGESPRSNLAFWSCLAGTYARLNADGDSTTTIASTTPSHDEVACWLDNPELETEVEREQSSANIVRPEPYATAPMLRLGASRDENPPWQVLNLHTDHLGSVRLVTNVFGEVVSQHDYLPFGEEIMPIGSYNTHQFTGHERDTETGLDYMKARFYGDVFARFMSPDPLGGSAANPQSWNRYAYVQGNPLKLVDPSGRYSIMSDADMSELAHPDTGWWNNGQGGAVGWGHIPCALCDGPSGSLEKGANESADAAKRWTYIGGGLVVVGIILEQPEISVIGMRLATSAQATVFTAKTAAALANGSPENIASAGEEFSKLVIPGAVEIAVPGAEDAAKMGSFGGDAAAEALSGPLANGLVYPIAFLAETDFVPPGPPMPPPTPQTPGWWAPFGSYSY